MLNDPVVIVGVARTPMGAFQGDFASLAASDLGAVAIKAADRALRLAPEDVQEVIMGNVLPAGQGQAPARQASLKAELPLAVGCTTVNKMCGSAMKAAMLAHDLIVAGSADIVVAGGMESMTNAPYLMPKARSGYRMGHQTVLRSHVPGRPRGRLREGAADGNLRRGLRGDLRVHARSAGRLRAHVAFPRACRQQRRDVRLGNRAR
jgi:acetyl-CoA C-acetyltransferase